MLNLIVKKSYFEGKCPKMAPEIANLGQFSKITAQLEGDTVCITAGRHVKGISVVLH